MPASVDLKPIIIIGIASASRQTFPHARCVARLLAAAVGVMEIGENHRIAGTGLERLDGRVIGTGRDFAAIGGAIDLLYVAIAIATSLHHVRWLAAAGIGE